VTQSERADSSVKHTRACSRIAALGQRSAIARAIIETRRKNRTITGSVSRRAAAHASMHT